MLLHSYLSNPRINDNVKISTTSLIDSGCTAMAFADEESIVKRFGLEIKPLVASRSVRLADGSTQAAITHYFVFRLHLGQHSENLVFYVTKLSTSNPIILGIPWLKLHNPICDWKFMTISFGSDYCKRNCTNGKYLRAAYTTGQEDPTFSHTSSEKTLVTSSGKSYNTTVEDCLDDEDMISRNRRNNATWLNGQDGDVIGEVLIEEETFIRCNSSEKRDSLDLIRRKIDQADFDKFLENKPEITIDMIKEKLPDELKHHAEHFLAKNASILPPYRSWDHKIEVMPGKQVPSCKNRPFSPVELQCIKKWIDEMLEKGFIRQSSSPAAAPLLLVPKPAGGLRICQDYRGLNEVTIKNRYPLPLIRETLDSISGAQFYTKLDVISAFNRIRIAEGHEWMTAFITRFGLYEMLVTPFGLCNAPATFQNYINQILHDALDQYCTAYLDDVLIYSKTREEHTRHVNEVIGRLGNAGLQLDTSKSEFYTKKTKYLGLIISTERLSMDPEKVKSIVSWKEPSNILDTSFFWCRIMI